MIKITEQIPVKLSGRTSFKVEFPYNQDLVDIIKTYVPAIWSKKDLYWEVGANYLGQMLDQLVYYDNIELRLLSGEIREISSKLTERDLENFKYKPYAHQIDAINFGLNKNKWLLLDSMGLGKSLECMYLAETLYNRGEIEHCLIICGVDSLRTNWKSEIKKFSNLSCVVLGEYITKTGNIRYKSIKERAEQLINPISEFFIIVNVSTIRDDKIIEAFKKSKNKIDMIAVDECHRCLSGDTVVKTTYGDLTLNELSTLDRPLPQILSYNKKSNKNEFKQILDVIVLEPSEPLIELTIEDSNIIYTIKCTESHKIYTTNRGWVKAKDLNSLDDIKIIS